MGCAVKPTFLFEASFLRCTRLSICYFSGKTPGTGKFRADAGPALASRASPVRGGVGVWEMGESRKGTPPGDF